MRTLSVPELNRALLARQLLLERAALTPAQALRRIDGLQAQYAPSMYVGLWSRTAGFARADLDDALAQRRVVQATTLRATIHLVAPADYWPAVIATREARRDLHRRHAGRDADAEMTAAAQRLRAELAGGATLRRTEVEALLGREVARGVGLWVDLVRVPPSGTWARRRADLLGLAEDWLGPPPAGLDEAGAVDHVVRRYLAGFGPASRADVISFTGLAGPTADAALGRLRLRRFAAPDGTPLLDVPGAPLPDADTPAPVRFLPTWDAALLVHARRAGILPEAHRPKVFSTRMPQSVGTFLVDGAVAGAWRPRDGAIVLEPWERLDASARRAVDAEAQRLTALHA